MCRLKIPTLIALFFLLFIAPAAAITDAELDAVSRQEAAQVEARYGLISDPAAVSRVQGVLNRVLAQAKPTQWVYQIKILNDKAPNAFAFPNGWIYVNSGLLNMPITDSELAFVLAHETAHVTEGHARKQIDQAMLTGTIIGILTGGNNRWVQLAGEVLQATLQSGFSREQETIADTIGLEMMYKAGYDPHGALTFFRKLAAVEGGEGIRIFPSHPRTADREHNLEQLVAKYHYPPTPPTASLPPVVGAPPPATSTAPSPGLAAIPPDFTLQDANGRKWRLMDHMGQGTVLIYFWDASVGLTAQALPDLNRLQQELGSRVTVVAIHANVQSHELARAWLQKMNLNIPMLFDDGSAFSAYGVAGASPQTILVDAQGRMRYRAIARPNMAYLRRALAGMGSGTGLLAWAYGGLQVDATLLQRNRTQLAIVSEPVGARMTVNGKSRGRAPRTMELPAGKYLVELTRPGAAPARFVVNLEKGTLTHLYVPVQ